jgi:type IX secretion system PorP/SprF family membrane protein
MKQRYIILTTGLALGGCALRAQDPQLSQFYAAPLYLNPALTGNTVQERAIMNYRTQWNGLPNGYDTYALSYDHRTDNMHHGYGILAMHDNAGSHDLAFTHVAVSYAYEAPIDRRRSVRFGLKLGYTMRDYDRSSVLFADQIIRDNAASSIETSMIERTSYFDMGAGGMYYTEQFWIGTSLSHLNRPQQTLVNDGDVHLPIRTSVHTGYRMPIDGKKMRRSSSFATLAGHYKSQGKWDQMDIGAYITHKDITGGLWYRGLPGLKAYRPGYSNDDAIVLLVGFETNKQLRITYSYDVTISTLGMKSAGAHEISLSYEWPKRSPSKKFRAVPCPKF